MARSVIVRGPIVPRIERSPETEPTEVQFFVPPVGVDTLHALRDLPPGASPKMVNLRDDLGILKSRYGTKAQGSERSSAYERLFTVFESPVTVSATQEIVPVLFSNKKVATWDINNVPDDWTDAGGSAIDAFEVKISAAQWGNDLVVFAPGVAGKVSGVTVPVSGAATVAQLTGSPEAAGCTVFGNRVVAWFAENIPSRIRWSAKLLENDWTGLGSGFEDLVYSGPAPDYVARVSPIADDVAFITRATSVWEMRPTGFVDVPFSFKRLVVGTGAAYRHTVADVPGGVIFVGADDVYLVTRQGIQRIGTQIYNSLTRTTQLCADFNGVTSSYRIADGTNTVWEYSLITKRWYQQIYPFNVAAVSAPHVAGIPGSNLSDIPSPPIFRRSTIEQVPPWYLLMHESSGRFVVVESTTRTRDIDGDGLDVDSGIEIRTPILTHTAPEFDVDLLRTQLRLLIGETQTIMIDFSRDGGSTWTQYTQRTLTPSTIDKLIIAAKFITSRGLMLRITTSTLGSMHLLGFKGSVVRGPERRE